MTDGVAQGTTLRAARERLRMTQEHLAEAAGISARTVLRAEKGGVVSAENLRALCTVLRLDVEALPLPGESGAGEDEPEPTATSSLAAEPETEVWPTLRDRVVPQTRLALHCVGAWVDGHHLKATWIMAVVGLLLIAWAVDQAWTNPLSSSLRNEVALRYGVSLVLLHAGCWLARWLMRQAPDLPRLARHTISLLAAFPALVPVGSAYLYVGGETLRLARGLNAALASRAYLGDLLKAEGVEPGLAERVGNQLSNRLLLDAFGPDGKKMMVAGNLDDLLSRPSHEMVRTLRDLRGSGKTPDPR